MSRKFTAGKLAVSLMIIISSIAGSAAYADNKNDVFNTNTKPSAMPFISGNAALGNHSPVARWFDAVDIAVYQHQPNQEEKVLLGRAFNKEANRVIAWTNTTANVARRYRELARILKTMPIPAGTSNSDLPAYKTLAADWYNDTAELMEDWIRPRVPAGTQEELKAQLDEMDQRSEAQAATRKDLDQMDKKLREQFDVRPPDDALMRYVVKKQPQ